MVEATREVLTSSNQVGAQRRLRVFIIGAPLGATSEVLEQFTDDRGLAFKRAMKRIHRIDGKFRVIGRTKQRDMTSL